MKPGMLVRIKLKDQLNPGLTGSGSLILEDGRVVFLSGFADTHTSFKVLKVKQHSAYKEICLLSFPSLTSEISASERQVSWVETKNLCQIAFLKKHND